MILSIECRYADFRYAECRDYLNVMLSVVMMSNVTLNVIILSVVMLSVMAPDKMTASAQGLLFIKQLTITLRSFLKLRCLTYLYKVNLNSCNRLTFRMSIRSFVIIKRCVLQKLWT